MHPNHITLLINPSKAHTKKAAKLLGNCFQSLHIPFTVVETQPSHEKRSTLPKDSDLILACGGDGTVLEAAHRNPNPKTPIAGINLGYLGYLSAIHGKTPKELQEATKTLLAIPASISRRQTLRVHNHQEWALNDIVLHRSAGICLIHLELYLNGEFVTEYRADGLIISTATGSTAYSLAAGGPILFPESKNIAICPIAPHSLGNRALIASKDDTITLKLKNRSGEAQISVDGTNLPPLQKGQSLTISKGKHPVLLLRNPETGPYNILVEKLGWKPLPE
jgi:NAD+ kinase